MELTEKLWHTVVQLTVVETTKSHARATKIQTSQVEELNFELCQFDGHNPLKKTKIVDQ